MVPFADTNAVQLISNCRHWSLLLKVIFNLSEIKKFAPDYDSLTHIYPVVFFLVVKYT